MDIISYKKAVEAHERIDNIDGIDQLEFADEITDSREDVDNVKHDTLKARLDSDYTTLQSDIDDIAESMSDEELVWYKPTLINGWKHDNFNKFRMSKMENNLVLVTGGLQGLSKTSNVATYIPEEFLSGESRTGDVQFLLTGASLGVAYARVKENNGEMYITNSANMMKTNAIYPANNMKLKEHYVRIIDEDGLFVRDGFVDELTEFTIETECPDGFILPKWNGTEWVEGGEEPETLSVEPTMEERLEALEKLELERIFAND